MKRIILTVLTVLMVFILVGCKTTDITETPEKVYYSVTFDAMGGENVSPQTIETGQLAVEPVDPEKEGFSFEYWYTSDVNTPFLFTTPIISNITLNALWKADPIIIVKTNEELIQEDIDALEDSIYVSRYFIDTPSRGPVNNSLIVWSSTSKYISRNGIVLPLLSNEEAVAGTIKARFSLNGTVVNHQFDVPLSHPDPVVIENQRTVQFQNKTTEYDVADTEVNLLFEENGSVPYIKISDFFNLLEGFIDPKYEFTYELEGSILTVSYDYLDEDENQDYLDGLSDFDGLYHLQLILDTVENTISTPDPGFYWAYVYSTATNYGRHIKYDRDNENAYYDEGDTLIYDLDDYSMDIIMYENDAVLPYYIANQLFAGSSYYNVYYNFDGLYGIYSLPEYGETEYEAIHNSSVSKQSIPADLVAHTFNFLGFAFNEFYGTQEVMGIEDYYDMLFSRKDELLNDNASLFDDILFNIISKDIDEPHTSYGYPGYYNDPEYYGPRLTSLEQLGPRVSSFYNDGLYAVDDAIAAKWDITPTSWAADDPNRPLYWFLNSNKTAVVLSLDGFNTSDIEESSTYQEDLLDAILNVSGDSIVPAITNGNKYFFYNNSTQEIELAEILVKGLTQNVLTTYVADLETNGFIYDQSNKLYTKSFSDKHYGVKVGYDDEFQLFYLGVLQLDSTEELNDFVDNLAAEIHDLILGDSAVYMEMYLEKIMKETTILDSIILDLTFNTGGNVGALYRVLGFVTEQPFKVSSMDGDTNSTSIGYVYIDGVPNYSHLNWGILQSPATFSAANQMSTIFKENGLGVIIGTQSGGGASSITPILLPNGSAFTMSSNSINAFTTETGDSENPYEFHSNEFGIVPDVEVSLEDIYDSILLLSILTTYYKK